jgi:hypothetical protein
MMQIGLVFFDDKEKFFEGLGNFEFGAQACLFGGLIGDFYYYSFELQPEF